MAGRLKDPDERVRRSAVAKLIDWGLIHPITVSAETYREIGERVKDRKGDIKVLAMVGLARLYCRYISSTVPRLSEANMSKHSSSSSLRSLVDGDIYDRLSFIPGLIIKCWSFPDIHTKHLIVSLFQERLLPTLESLHSNNESAEPTVSSGKRRDSRQQRDEAEMQRAELNERRATALILLFESLDSVDRNAFASMMSFKAKTRSELQNFLVTRSKTVPKQRVSSADSTNPDSLFGSARDTVLSGEGDEQLRAMRKAMLKLMQIVPPMEKKTAFIERLYEIK